MNTINIDFSKSGGIVPVIIQDYKTSEVLMLAYMNEEAYSLSMKTGLAHYWSRSKKRIWKKGESSGHTQEIREVRIDCDSDTILMKVNQIGDAACHEGYRSCFFRRVENNKTVIDGEKIFEPSEVYDNKK
ncbi:MAG TPA: phosphoribosyl-AMP cyclohydrolase [Spirochaetota bacterium]|nr:phosphoribosyl-AMP cyclohydrolase [Spirochaetota bacterium]HPJ33285.1 phosphoribosyl-AMP cyclohydrolase [Spirochaetota bacterium]